MSKAKDTLLFDVCSIFVAHLLKRITHVSTAKYLRVYTFKARSLCVEICAKRNTVLDIYVCAQADYINFIKIERCVTRYDGRDARSEISQGMSAGCASCHIGEDSVKKSKGTRYNAHRSRAPATATATRYRAPRLGCQFASCARASEP